MPEKAIQVIKDESKSGVIPSTQVIKMVLAKIKGNPELIEQFRFTLPFETEAYELVCEAELQQKCQNVYKGWIFLYIFYFYTNNSKCFLRLESTKT